MSRVLGTTHYCNACHDDFQRLANIPKQELPQCPVAPKVPTGLKLRQQQIPLPTHNTYMGVVVREKQRYFLQRSGVYTSK